MRHAITLILVAAFCLSAGPLLADGTVAFTSDATGSFPKTIVAERGKIAVDLSAIGKDVKVFRAVLWPGGPISTRGNREKPEPVSVKAGDKELPLLPPRYRGFVCTDAVAKAVAAGEKLAFTVVSLPGYDGKSARLEVTCSAAPKAKPPAVKEINAFHNAGQTFITFAQPNPPVADEKINSEQLAKLIAALDKQPDKTTFRVYRHSAAITSKNVAEAELVDEVGPLTCWNDDIQGHYTLRVEVVGIIDIPRYVIKDGEKPVAPGTGIVVHNPKAAGKAFYAVTTAVGGEEDFATLGAGSATAEAVAETVGAGVPVCQREKVIVPGNKEKDHFFYNSNCTVRYYVRWEVPPNCNMPKPLNYLVGVPAGKFEIHPVCISLHGWGGTMFGGGSWQSPDRGTLLMSTNQIPYDWWTGYHEALGTWRSWGDGAVWPYSQNRLISFVDWMATKWPVDLNAVSVGGASMGGSGTTNLCVHRSKRIAWGAGYVGVHVPDSSPQFTSSYIGSYGPVVWQLPYLDQKVSAFDFFSNEWYVLNHVGEDLGLICFSNGKNDGAIGWPQALRFFRALQKARQPHVWCWGMGGHGQGLKTAGGKGNPSFNIIDVRTDRTLPAFTNCSIDDNPGTAKQLSAEEYAKLKEDVAAWNKENPKKPKAADKYDGDSAGLANGWLFWHTAADRIVDEPGRWEMTVALENGAPKAECTVDITPRRCQKFSVKKGEKVSWKNVQQARLATGVDEAAGGKEVQSGEATADEFGLITLEKVKISKDGNRIVIEKK